MMNEPLPDLALLDAWMDGEPVPRHDIAALLATDEGRTYAIDVMALRRVMHVDAPTQTRSRGPVWWPMVAAASIVIGIAGGFFAGTHLTRDNTTAAERASTSSAAVVPASAPAPTRVIQLEVGVDWNEGSGGN